MIINRLQNLPARTHTVAAVASVAALGLTNAILEASYAASKFPVPFATGQTTFSGSKLKSYYAVMVDAGTLDTYWLTQGLDFLFITAMAICGLVVGSRFAKAATTSWQRRFAVGGGAALVMGAAFDVVENLISFVMLAQPATFPDWLAVIYSAAAVAKFALLVPGVTILAVTGLVLGLSSLVDVVRSRRMAVQGV